MASQIVESGVVGGEPPRGFRLEVRGHALPLTDGIRRYATDHVALKLAKHARAIQTVVIRVADVNGAKGGEDKQCEVEVVLRRVPSPLVVTATDHDLHAAMDGAADRAQKAVGRALERKRATPRLRGHKLVRARKLLGSAASYPP
jgi:ribosome-associated translation inhibitor RaiA